MAKADVIVDALHSWVHHDEPMMSHVRGDLFSAIVHSSNCPFSGIRYNGKKTVGRGGGGWDEGAHLVVCREAGHGEGPPMPIHWMIGLSVGVPVPPHLPHLYRLQNRTRGGRDHRRTRG